VNGTILVIVVIVAVFVLLFFKLQKGQQAWPFYAKKLLSPAEQVLYFRLVQALPDSIIFAQVQLSRIYLHPPILPHLL
jgi:hypothetical protein